MTLTEAQQDENAIDAVTAVLSTSGSGLNAPLLSEATNSITNLGKTIRAFANTVVEIHTANRENTPIGTEESLASYQYFEELVVNQAKNLKAMGIDSQSAARIEAATIQAIIQNANAIAAGVKKGSRQR